MFEIIFHIQLSVSFLFFSNSGTTCCLHYSSETKVPVILFNENSLPKCQEILSLRKGQGLRYSTFELPTKMDKSHGYHMECYRKFTALSKAQREKLGCLKNTRTDSSNNTISVSRRVFFNYKRSDIKSPKPSKTGIFPNVCLFCNKARKRIKNVEQKLVNVETQNFEKSIKKYVQWMGDANLSARLTGVDFAAKEVKYHSYCRIKYQTEAEGKHNQEKRMAGESCMPETSASI